MFGWESETTSAPTWKNLLLLPRMFISKAITVHYILISIRNSEPMRHQKARKILAIFASKQQDFMQK